MDYILTPNKNALYFAKHFGGLIFFDWLKKYSWVVAERNWYERFLLKYQPNIAGTSYSPCGISHNTKANLDHPKQKENEVLRYSDASAVNTFRKNNCFNSSDFLFAFL